MPRTRCGCSAPVPSWTICTSTSNASAGEPIHEEDCTRCICRRGCIRTGEADDDVQLRFRYRRRAAEGVRLRGHRQGEARQVGRAGGGRCAERQERPGADRRRYDRYRFPIAYTGPELKDLRLSVKCKPIAGKGDQGCGIIWRLREKDNYYVTRANALEDNVHLYHVVDGRRARFAGWNGKVASGVWHELSVDMVGNHIQVFFDGSKVIDDHDDTIKEAGKVGVWTKADSIVQFDDLVATPK